MLAVIKPEAAAGADVGEIKVPGFGPTDVLVKVGVAFNLRNRLAKDRRISPEDVLPQHEAAV